MNIYCCGCSKYVKAILTNGAETYPHRKDLAELPFWKCRHCNNFVGCHHKTKNRTRPLGFIPTPELKNARKHIHMILDPLWKEQNYSRKEIYRSLTDSLGYKYHTAKIKNIQQARIVYRLIKKMYYHNNTI